jgi:hypothetical protein
MKSALQQVSDKYEAAKQAYYAMDPVKTPNEQLLVALTEIKIWGNALQILQDQRGNFVG